ncbi:MAG: hypothetical protein IRY83_03970 [Chloroflexi bacterium]|nr:hypothetical protein [Chloroflexota bacterium]
MINQHHSTALRQRPASRPEPPASPAVRAARQRWQETESAQALADFEFALRHPFWREEVGDAD